jgi:hypothetical protein
MGNISTQNAFLNPDHCTYNYKGYFSVILVACAEIREYAGHQPTLIILSLME